MTTTVVNIRRHDYDVYMGRAGRGEDGYFGNPTHRGSGTPGSTLNEFSDYFFNRLEEDHEFKQRVFDLRGKRLGCFCVVEPWTPDTPGAFICHAQVIAHYLETTRDNVE